MNESDKELPNPYDPEVSVQDFGRWVDQQIEKMRKRQESVFGVIRDIGGNVDTDENNKRMETLEKETREHYWRQRQSMKNILEHRGIDDDGSMKEE